MLIWRRGCSHSVMGIWFFYMWNFFVVLPEVYIFILLYEWRRGCSQSDMGICCGFVEIYAHLEERV